jgi:CRISPR/Cas system CSM-associated protein Csm3 (group 7 of RAMP superfamily)
MNPYDFVRIDWNQPPLRRSPIWHNRLVGRNGQHLYSGQLEISIYTETPLFIFDPRAESKDPRKPTLSMRNPQGDYIIPGSTLKGVLRNVVETLGRGCMTLFDGDYEQKKINYTRELPRPFHHCENVAELCIACRIFGMLRERANGVYLGKINIGDAVGVKDTIALYPDPFYTKPLMNPKPHHASFYLDVEGKHIAGRKFYFHHAAEARPLSDVGPRKFGDKPANRYIQPVDYKSEFRCRLDFTNLESDELSALLLAITLDENMRHKLGSGKPLGMGSVEFRPKRLTIVDYAQRYKTMSSNSGKTTLEGDHLWNYIYEQVDAFTAPKLSAMAMEDLQRIWRWPADPDADYAYPSKRDWFDTPKSIGKRIADTRDIES